MKFDSGGEAPACQNQDAKIFESFRSPDTSAGLAQNLKFFKNSVIVLLAAKVKVNEEEVIKNFLPDMIISKTFNKLYPRLLGEIIKEGEKVKKAKTIEISPFIFKILDPTPSFVLYKNLNLNYPSLIMKRLQILNGTADMDALCFYDPLIKKK